MPAVGHPRFSPPSYLRTLKRQRLLDKLIEHENRRVIFIQGQAAQGKSTLASSFVQSAEMPTVWINLTPGDENPVNLYYAIGTGLNHLLDQKDPDVLLNYPARQMGPRDPQALYQDWVTTLFSQVRHPLRITFDGLDRPSQESQSFGFLQVMLEESPAHMQFILLSRAAPPFPIHDWNIKQQAFVLDNQDLAFTTPEIRSYFRDICGVECTREQAKKIRNATEGWAGGIVLLSQILDSSNGGDSKGEPFEELPNRFKTHVFIYFANEIFSRLSEKQAWFLMHSSLFEELDPGFLDELLNMTGSEQILQGLVSRNLFVSSEYDPFKGWIYRYHLLFRDFLQQAWEKQVDFIRRQQFMRHAGKVSARRKNLEQAASFFLASKDHYRAASVVKVLGRRLIMEGRDKDLQDILCSFPERVTNEKPWLLLYQAHCRRYSHAAENVPILQKALAMFRTSQDTRGQLLTLGRLMEAVMLLGRDLVPVHDLLEEGESLLATLDSSTNSREQALLWLQMGFCYALRGQNTRDGYRASQNAYLLAQKLQDHPLQIQALIFSIIPMTFLGDFQNGDRLRIKVQTMLQKGRFPELEALFLKMWSELAMFAGRLDLDLAKMLIERLNQQIDQFGLVYFQAPAMYSAFAYHMYAGNAEQAEDIGLTLLKMSEIMDNDYGKGFSLILLGLLAYRHKQWSKARETIEAGLKIFRLPAMRSPLHDHEFSIGAGLIHTRLGNWQQAENLLQRSLEYFTAISSQLPRTESLMSLALLNEKKGNRKNALKYLEQGLALAASHQFSHFVVISPHDQLELCILAMEEGSTTAQDCARQLLLTGLTETVAQGEHWLNSHPHPRVRKAIEDVMRLRHRSHRPRVLIQTLNGFQVWLNDTLISDQTWEGNQAQNLLKAIVALGSGRKVRKELLIDELWPDSSPKAGEKTFKVALHRLRRSLEPDMSSRFGSSYVHLKKGLVQMDDHLCMTDVVQFHSLCSRAETQLEEGRTREALTTYAKAVALYREDFLARDIDAPWAEALRESLKQRYIQVLLRVARNYETLGSWTKAVHHYEMALECDPVLEEAYRRLMTLYADKGKRSQALQVFEKCRENLRKHVDVEPDEVTVSIYRRILG